MFYFAVALGVVGRMLVPCPLFAAGCTRLLLLRALAPLFCCLVLGLGWVGLWQLVLGREIFVNRQVILWPESWPQPRMQEPSKSLGGPQQPPTEYGVLGARGERGMQTAHAVPVSGAQVIKLQYLYGALRR